uniref:Putative secreted protein n=1 Tax=Anopheles darlingi TaxID=43151 RepID=A0A2M4DIC3_ANODA
MILLLLLLLLLLLASRGVNCHRCEWRNGQTDHTGHHRFRRRRRQRCAFAIVGECNSSFVKRRWPPVPDGMAEAAVTERFSGSS